MRRPTALGLAVLALAASPASAQEDVPPDSAAVPADSAVGELPGELVGVLADSAGAEDDSSFATLAPPLRPSTDRVPGTTVTWDRDRIRRSNATTLGELLSEMTRGTFLLRADYFGGPHHLIDGPLGPTALDLRVDGRPLLPLVGAQSDLSQLLFATVDEVRAERHAGGWRIDLTTLRREDRRAYSRIEAGTGDPDTRLLRLVFANGLGRSFTVRAGYELFDAENPESDLQGFSGAFAWLPGGGASGVELSYEQRSFDRSERFGETGSVKRLALHGRWQLMPGLRAGGWLGESRREVDEVEGVSDARDDGAVHGGLEVGGVWDAAWATARFRATEGGALPATEVEVEGGASLLGWLDLSAAGKIGSWDDFDTREGRAAIAARLPVAGLRVHAEAAGGTRGASYLAAEPGRADSLEFEAVAAGVSAVIGPVQLGGRVERQWVDRQLGFGTGFDAAGSFQPEAEVVGFEASAEMPVIPLSWIHAPLDPLRVRGFYRHNEIESARTPLYVPANFARGELYFEDSLLEGDLGVRIGLGLERRDPWLAAAPLGSVDTTPVAEPARTSWDFDLGIRIVGVLIYWRYDNLAGQIQRDLTGFEFPVRRQVFGVRWEFFE